MAVLVLAGGPASAAGLTTDAQSAPGAPTADALASATPDALGSATRDAPGSAALDADAASSDAASATAYLEPGIEAGVTHRAFYGAVQLDGGVRLGATPLWLHGRFAQGRTTDSDENTMSGDFTEARAGLEVRGCILDGIVCLVGGADLGYRHQMLTTNPGYSAATDPHAADAATNLGVAIGRLGLDLGNGHLRLRPSLETAVSQGGWNGLGLTAGIAYTW